MYDFSHIAKYIKIYCVEVAFKMRLREVSHFSKKCFI